MNQTYDHTRNDFAVPAARLRSVLESAEGASNALAVFQQALAALHWSMLIRRHYPLPQALW